MYSDHKSVNLLTAMLLAYGVEDAVVCPGARNAPISHNLHALGARLRLHPVTDERSAAFVALGIALRTGRPTALCVTSGSALLGTLPAVAEARMRHIPLLVISADRPARLVGQLEGQTLPQVGALQPYAQTFQLPERAEEEEDTWHLQHLLHRAFRELLRPGGGPCHVNVPIPEPLFGFSQTELPAVAAMHFAHKRAERPLTEDVMKLIAGAETPILLMGQRDAIPTDAVRDIEARGQMLVLPEVIAGAAGSWRTLLLEEAPLPAGDYVVVHVGGNLVGKKLKQNLQGRDDVRVVRIEEGDDMPDTFRHLHAVVHGDADAALRQLAETLPENARVRSLQHTLAEQWRESRELEAGLSLREKAFALLAQTISETHGVAALHLANSTPVRLARRYFDGGGELRILCNRGTNGIEGSASTAVGYTIADAALCRAREEKPKVTLLVTGDLSFFYDVNALWNTQLGGNLRILLLNDGGGSIFRTLPGLGESSACRQVVAAAHNATAEGVCRSFGAAYLRAETEAELAAHITTLLTAECGQPMVVDAVLQDQ